MNSGEGNASVTFTASMPPEAASWELIGHDGGVDSSSPTTLRVEALPVPAGNAARVDFTLRVAEVPAGTPITVSATYTVDDGGSGVLEAPAAVVGSDTLGTEHGDDETGELLDDGEWRQDCSCDTGGGVYASGSGAVGLLLVLALPRRRRA